jgi:hypothetical protein
MFDSLTEAEDAPWLLDTAILTSNWLAKSLIDKVLIACKTIVGTDWVACVACHFCYSIELNH